MSRNNCCKVRSQNQDSFGLLAAAQPVWLGLLYNVYLCCSVANYFLKCVAFQARSKLYYRPFMYKVVKLSINVFFWYSFDDVDKLEASEIYI